MVFEKTKVQEKQYKTDDVSMDLIERNVLYVMCKHQKAEIKTNSTTKTANIQREVRQGYPLPPLFFTIT